jgi:hypothetical protein
MALGALLFLWLALFAHGAYSALLYNWTNASSKLEIWTNETAVDDFRLFDENGNFNFRPSLGSYFVMAPSSDALPVTITVPGDLIIAGGADVHEVIANLLMRGMSDQIFASNTVKTFKVTTTAGLFFSNVTFGNTNLHLISTSSENYFTCNSLRTSGNLFMNTSYAYQTTVNTAVIQASNLTIAGWDYVMDTWDPRGNSIPWQPAGDVAFIASIMDVAAWFECMADDLNQVSFNVSTKLVMHRGVGLQHPTPPKCKKIVVTVPGDSGETYDQNFVLGPSASLIANDIELQVSVMVHKGVIMQWNGAPTGSIYWLNLFPTAYQSISVSVGLLPRVTPCKLYMANGSYSSGTVDLSLFSATIELYLGDFLTPPSAPTIVSDIKFEPCPYTRLHLNIFRTLDAVDQILEVPTHSVSMFGMQLVPNVAQTGLATGIWYWLTAFSVTNSISTIGRSVADGSMWNAGVNNTAAYIYLTPGNITSVSGLPCECWIANK